MEKDTLKKTAVIAIAVIMILLFVSVPVMYLCLEAPLSLIALAAAMAYYARERLKEIEEGLDDAVDDY